MKKRMSLSDSKRGIHLRGFNFKSTHSTKLSSSSQPSSFNIVDKTIAVDNAELSSNVHNRILSIVQTYQELMNLDRINEEQADILEKILKLSEANPILCQMLSIVDENLPTNAKRCGGRQKVHGRNQSRKTLVKTEEEMERI